MFAFRSEGTEVESSQRPENTAELLLGVHLGRIALAVAWGLDLEEGERRSRLGGTPSLSGRRGPTQPPRTLWQVLLWKSDQDALEE